MALGCHPRLLYTSDHPSGPSCLSSRGCPPAAPVPACPSDLPAPATVEELLARSDVQSTPVVVQGPLARGNGTCTLLACYGPTRDGACCNKCGLFLALGKSLMLQGPGLGCAGDESLICCTVEPRGQTVVARGVLRLHGTTFVLEDARLCAPSS